ncbi:hypothetical protein A3H10_01410 [Candidatus Uhrbacteria bacterium RIFCSPLOWO2_12_FULL_46_10]|uniref:Dipeptidylpeptidase IV N-terminal domain-containing protein n=1 Tax=Candidatus Uhrbacteria bacterium RIFCSPLOWO2_01_FULL_47_25 TaxID=1802402 RepID=A0A1F7UT25_9BACT|nr:MAG: hypothetical protein UX68_C0001G0057 [Parcubacteria group bacterium GW2011_GWA2_46_9]OGL60737.1 MAG: hypothetical protein A2752_03295 [Candidatus Uhrbacteria bacterium RIFCSPHIGHO2_01_FULL_46_23]OGL69549.1 MAG: hypothetical protein A3D60_00920 [Candidatus Uhrbacteria bacterium RIFCSPHIGHO2_02_FULL_47_29]OGL76011.1 MAG: hypothetical protein A3E96_02140 [Candidatus Uhrbacteria bacterium RIFCSPHIGHO2_12_FULL_46_13]OGL81409.1 MAG: hypothetical protein A2936_00240 [Candidatus Uhrbacteria bac
MVALSYKRALAIIGFIALTIFFAVMLYLLFFRQPTTPITNEITGGPAGRLPPIGTGRPGTGPTGGPGGLPIGEEIEKEKPSKEANGGLTEITPIISTLTDAPTTDGQTVLYYQPTDGLFYRITPEGQVNKLSEQVFYNVSQVTWSPNRSAAVLEYPDGSNIVYNFQTKSQVTLPKHWEEFSFSPDGNQLAFKSMGIDRDSRWLAVSNASGGDNEAIEPLGDNAKTVTVTWSPNRQIVALQREVTGTDKQEIFFIGLQGENFRSMTVPGLGLRSQWTPDGRSLLYSVSSPANDYKPMLWIAGASGENIGANRHSLGLNTWADKCAFTDAANVICAVPQELPAGAGLTPGIAATIPDNLYSVNLNTGEKKLLAIPSTNITAENVMVTSDKKWIFLKEALTGNLYKVALP